MPLVFISYRRSDTQMVAGRLREALARHFGEAAIFRDKDSVAPGEDWTKAIKQELTEEVVVVALIGPNWATAKDEAGGRRLDDPTDWNRVELEEAMKRGCKLIPMLVDDTKMPKERDLPESLRSLTRTNALKLRDDDWGYDVERLTHVLDPRSNSLRMQHAAVGQGSIIPKIRVALTPIAWRRVAAVFAIALVPLAWFLLESLTRDYRVINSAALSPDQTMTATASGIGIGVKARVWIWDAKTGEMRHTLRAGEGPVWTVAWSPNGRYLAYGDQSGTLTIIDADGWQERSRFEETSGILEQIAWNPDSDRVATGDKKGTIRVWSVGAKALLFTANSHTDNIAMLAWSPTGEKIASASWDRTVAVTDGLTGKLLYRVGGYSSYVTSVAWSADGKMVASGSLESPHLRIWRDNQPGVPTELAAHNAAVDAVKWSPTDLLLASADRDHSVRLWNVSTGAVERVLDAGGNGAAPDLAWSGDGKLVAVTGDEILSIWDVGTGRRLQHLEAQKNDYAVRIVGWSQDARSLTTRGSFYGVLKTWNLGEPTPTTTIHIGVFRALMDMIF